MSAAFDARPIIGAIAGPNGAGKSTFYHAHLSALAVRFVNADDLAREIDIDATEAGGLATELRKTLVELGESFVFETVFSDPVGDEVEFLRAATERGYTVVVCFIGIPSVAVSDERVAMRVLQGGHDVPADKIIARYPRTLVNLERAVHALPHVLVFDNSDLSRPFRKVAEFCDGAAVAMVDPLPAWLARWCETGVEATPRSVSVPTGDARRGA